MRQRLYGAADRQPHNGVIVALDAVQPQGRAPLNGIGTGLIVGLRGSSVERDFFLPQREKGHLAAVHKMLCPVPFCNAHAGVHLMGLAGERAQHPLGILCVMGLAEHSAVHVHHGVAADDHGIRVLFCHCKALADGQLLHQLRRSGGSDGALIKIADTDREIGGVQGKQLPSAGAARG